MEISPSAQRAILRFAADVLSRRLGGNPRPLTSLDDPVFSRPAGCFVSIHRRNPHALRGCIGIVDATRPLRNTLVSAAESVIGDPRFLSQAITRQELPDTTIEVTLLGPMVKAKSTLDFDPLAHGIFLTFRGRSGLFLPQVARETGWSRQQLLSRLCTEKLGVPESAWSDPAAELSTFPTIVIGPVPFAELWPEESPLPSLT